MICATRSTSFLNSRAPCPDVLDNLFTATSVPFRSLPYRQHQRKSIVDYPRLYRFKIFEQVADEAWKLWKDGSPVELVDPAIGENCESNEVIRCIHIALLCVQEDPADRPMMSTIILMLTSDTVTLPVPRQPGFLFQSGLDRDTVAEDLESGQYTGKSVPSSVNDATVTDLDPR